MTSVTASATISVPASSKMEFHNVLVANRALRELTVKSTSTNVLRAHASMDYVRMKLTAIVVFVATATGEKIVT